MPTAGQVYRGPVVSPVTGSEVELIGDEEPGDGDASAVDNPRSQIGPAARRELRERLSDGVQFDEPMRRHTTLKIGGPADAFAEPARAADAELAIALGVAVAFVDRVEVVPDAQQVRHRRPRQPVGEQVVGVLRGGGETAVRGFVDFDAGAGVVAVLAPGDRAVAVATHDAAAAPDLERRRRGNRLQRNAPVARIAIACRRGGAEADHREHARIGEQRGERFVRVAHRQAWQRRLGDRRGGALRKIVGKRNVAHVPFAACRRPQRGA